MAEEKTAEKPIIQRNLGPIDDTAKYISAKLVGTQPVFGRRSLQSTG